MNAAGDIYLDSYAGWYSVRDERFYAEDELELRDGGNRYSIETGTPVTWTEEQTYFFRLSAYADRLLAHYADHPEFIGPEVRRNEVVSFVSGGLRDLSIHETPLIGLLITAESSAGFSAHRMISRLDR